MNNPINITPLQPQNLHPWMNPGFNDASWQTGIGSIGFGDGDDIYFVRMIFNWKPRVFKIFISNT